MNKSKLIKTILVILIGMMLMFSTNVFADDLDDILDFGDDDDTSTTTGGDTSSIITDDSQPSSTRAQNTSVPSSGNDELTVETTKDTSDKTDKSTSVYDTKTTTPSTEKTPETISKAGIEDSIPMVLIAVFAISAIYAFKKINEYKNI